jgi:hypothetical protein
MYDTSSKAWDFYWDNRKRTLGTPQMVPHTHLIYIYNIMTGQGGTSQINNYYFKGKEVSAALAYPIPTGHETKLRDKFIVLVTRNN